MKTNKPVREVSREVFEHVVEWHECPACGARVNPVHISWDSKGRRILSAHCYKCEETKRLVIENEAPNGEIIMACTDDFGDVNWDKMLERFGGGDEDADTGIMEV